MSHEGSRPMGVNRSCLSTYNALVGARSWMGNYGRVCAFFIASGMGTT